jgi:hypothetical protein
MKKNEVPQDESKLETADIREMCYAVDEDGQYTTALSTGWDPKTIALDNALQQVKERVDTAKHRVLKNETSPIEYYMELHKMDLTILASYVGLWKWRVKRHFKPSVFKRLNQRTLEKYAEVFDVSVDQLKNIRA